MDLRKYDNLDNSYMKDYVYKVLKKNIMELRLKPGLNLKKEKIAKELQVSITPIREAFARLSEDSLVNVYPQRGTYVSHINLQKVDQAKFMREHLESTIVRLACKEFSKKYLIQLQTNVKMQEIYVEEEDSVRLFELDNAFHHILFEGCNKGDIWTTIQQFSTHVSRLRLLSLVSGFNREKVISDHQKIVEAIIGKDEDLADEIVKTHINQINIDINKLQRDYPNYFENTFY